LRLKNGVKLLKKQQKSAMQLMKIHNFKLGGLMSAFLAISILPVRLSEGQAANPVNLIGSEIVIWLMCLTFWSVINLVYNRMVAATWQKILVSVLLCAVLSNLFYLIFNPAFEDYPMMPLYRLPLWLAVIRLSLRGLLIGAIFVPVIFLLENERKIQRAKVERERQRADQAEQQKVLLEALVAERTEDLRQILSTLQVSRNDLDNQIYLLSRLVTSITHDVHSPLKYMTIIAKRINIMVKRNELVTVNEYVNEIEKSLEGVTSMMGNLLDFAKGQINKETLHLNTVNLGPLVREKISLFNGILEGKKNTLEIDIDPQTSVETNYNLLAVIVHNLLDNAAKYTNNGLIRISTNEVEESLHLVIENSALNFPGDTPANFKMSERNDFVSMLEMKGQGIGLALVKDIAGLLNINFFMKPAPGKVIAHVVFPTWHKNA
jgi:signal transduction histidine kinase